jgi:hypothetical protein
MNRFVLALLALLAGLVTQTAPAHARLSAGSGAQVAVHVPGTSQRVVVALRKAAHPLAVVPQTRLQLVITLDPQEVVLPDFYAGIDRARE